MTYFNGKPAVHVTAPQTSWVVAVVAPFAPGWYQVLEVWSLGVTPLPRGHIVPLERLQHISCCLPSLGGGTVRVAFVPYLFSPFRWQLLCSCGSAQRLLFWAAIWCNRACIPFSLRLSAAEVQPSASAVTWLLGLFLFSFQGVSSGIKGTAFPQASHNSSPLQWGSVHQTWTRQQIFFRFCLLLQIQRTAKQLLTRGFLPPQARWQRADLSRSHGFQGKMLLWACLLKIPLLHAASSRNVTCRKRKVKSLPFTTPNRRFLSLILLPITRHLLPDNFETYFLSVKNVPSAPEMSQYLCTICLPLTDQFGKINPTNCFPETSIRNPLVEAIQARPLTPATSTSPELLGHAASVEGTVTPFRPHYLLSFEIAEV